MAGTGRPPDKIGWPSAASKSLPDYGLPLGMTSLGIWFKTWLHDKQSPRDYFFMYMAGTVCSAWTDRMTSKLQDGAMMIFSSKSDCIIATSDSLFVSVRISLERRRKKWQIKFLLSRKLQLERPPRHTFALTFLSGQTFSKSNPIHCVIVIGMFLLSNSTSKLHKCTAVLLQNLGDPWWTLCTCSFRHLVFVFGGHFVVLNFCPSLAAAALTCDTQGCSFTLNPTHKCDTQSWCTSFTFWRKHKCCCSKNFGRLSLSILELVEFHCDAQLSLNGSSGMKWIWIWA